MRSTSTIMRHGFTMVEIVITLVLIGVILSLV
ncbi:type II secretion system protein [Patescibacteria group bacterium]|nr:type II secretion system protein [Patescibacteria group bacterium]